MGVVLQAHAEEKLEEERKRRDLPIQSRPLWLRCVLNVTMLRMCDEVYWAFLAWHHGRVAVFSARFDPDISRVAPRKNISRVVLRLFFFLICGLPNMLPKLSRDYLKVITR